MKRAVEADWGGLRKRSIVALGASMSKFAIVVARDSRAYEPEQLKDQAIAVTPNNGSHFTTLKMMEGFLTPEHLKTTNVGPMAKRLEALREGNVAAVSLMEPWISVAQKQGMRILIESHSTRSEAASEDLDGPTLAAMFRARSRRRTSAVTLRRSLWSWAAARLTSSSMTTRNGSPRCVVIAGPNGAGKTTFAREFLTRDAKIIHFVNADLIAGGLSPLRPDLVAIAAGRLFIAEIDRMAASHVDFAFESTLSGLGYVPRFKR